MDKALKALTLLQDTRDTCQDRLNQKSEFRPSCLSCNLKWSTLLTKPMRSHGYETRPSKSNTAITADYHMNNIEDFHLSHKIRRHQLHQIPSCWGLALTINQACGYAVNNSQPLLPLQYLCHLYIVRSVEHQCTHIKDIPKAVLYLSIREL